MNGDEKMNYKKFYGIGLLVLLVSIVFVFAAPSVTVTVNQNDSGQVTSIDWVFDSWDPGLGLGYVILELRNQNGQIVHSENDTITNPPNPPSGSIPFDQKLAPGGYNISLAFFKTDDSRYDNQTKEFNVPLIPTNITVNDILPPVIVNKSLNISGVLTSEDSPISSVWVRIRLYRPGNLVDDYNAQTDSNGVFSYIITSSTLSVLGDYNISVNYLGNGTYEPSNMVNKTFTVIPPPIPTNLTLSLSSDNINFGENVTLTAKLTNASGNPIPNANITFNINGNNYSNSTNINGIATYIFTPDRAGKYNIIATFKDNESYNDSTSENKILIVTGGNTPTPTPGFQLYDNITNDNGGLPWFGNGLRDTGFPLIILLVLTVTGLLYWRKK
jgi:hypothetical protein